MILFLRAQSAKEDSMELDMNEGQGQALALVKQWFGSKNAPPIFGLHGFAGTGKTFLIPKIVETALGVGLNCQIASPTNKAAGVLWDKLSAFGLKNKVDTVYSNLFKWVQSPEYEAAHKALMTIYTAILEGQEKGANHLSEIKRLEQIKSDNPPRHISIFDALQNGEFKETTKNPETGEDEPVLTLKDYKILIIDEASMVGEDVMAELAKWQSIGLHVLAVGDPFQLPPVQAYGKTKSLTDVRRDILLDEVVRQGKDSPILKLATFIRNGNDIRRYERDQDDSHDVLMGGYDEEELRFVLENEALSDSKRPGRVLVGYHDNRKEFNNLIRDWYGFPRGGMPQEGEKLLCRKSLKRFSLYAGETYIVKKVLEETRSKLSVILEKEGVRKPRPQEFDIDKSSFLMETSKTLPKGECYYLDWGYTITPHSAQGSEWEAVYLVNDWRIQENKLRWQYTAVTRASGSLYVENR